MRFDLYFNRMRKIFAIAFALFLVVPPSVFSDPLQPFTFVQLTTDNNGDTITTSQVSVGNCPAVVCPTLISPAITNKTNRRRVIMNPSTFAVYIGSNSATLATTGFAIAGSSGTFTTFNTGAIYGVAPSTVTVYVIQESNSIP